MVAASVRILAPDPAVARWAQAACSAARDVLADPAMRARWDRHGGTWFVGVDALPTAPDGSIAGVPLAGAWRDAVAVPARWHKAQLSVVRPGFPGRDAGETAAAHAFRRDRAGAHLDGLLAEGPGKRRHLRDPHAFVLGLPLNACGAGASPLVVWEGSEAVIRHAFAQAYAGLPPARWGALDMTEVYQAARAQVFATCARRVIHAVPGQAVLMHRMAIHGVAPWQEGAAAPPEGRMIAYFRPLLDDPADWLARP